MRIDVFGCFCFLTSDYSQTAQCPCLLTCGVAEHYCIQKQSAAAAKHLNHLTNVRFCFVSKFYSLLCKIQVKYKAMLGLTDMETANKISWQFRNYFTFW